MSSDRITPTGRIYYDGGPIKRMPVPDMKYVLGIPITPEFQRWIDTMRCVFLCGYNPQRLLADHRPAMEKWDAAEFQRRLQSHLDGWAKTVPHEGRRYFVLSGDYSRLEAHLLASLIHESADPVVLDLGPGGGQIAGLFGYRFPVEPSAPAVKQNGRSAAYLQHDKTKQHRRRR